MNQKCATCHKPGGQAQFASFVFASEADYLTSKWFRAGDVNSLGLLRMKFSGGANASMPMGDVAWTQANYQTVRDWVVNATPPPTNTSFTVGGATSPISATVQLASPPAVQPVPAPTPTGTPVPSAPLYQPPAGFSGYYCKISGATARVAIGNGSSSGYADILLEGFTGTKTYSLSGSTGGRVLLVSNSQSSSNRFVPSSGSRCSVSVTEATNYLKLSFTCTGLVKYQATGVFDANGSLQCQLMP